MTHNKVTLFTQYWNALFKQKQSWFTWLIIILFIVSFIFLFFKRETLEFGEAGYYKDAIEPVITIGTFVIAAILGIQNVRKTWIDKLPKKLTVHFKYEDKNVDEKINKFVYTCHKAYLSGESDIRQMAQQIGRQMNNNVNLDFYPYMKLNPPTVELSTKKESSSKSIQSDPNADVVEASAQNESRSIEYFRHYEVTFFLSICDKTEYIIWWDNDPDKPGNKSLTTKNDRVISEMEAEALLEQQKQQNKA